MDLYDDGEELGSEILDCADNDKSILFCFGDNIGTYYGRIIGVTDEFKRKDCSGDGDSGKVSNILDSGDIIL
mgnify:CR=1 FL=1